MTLEVPETVTLSDGSTAEVKAVTAGLIDGQIGRVVYTVERRSGAWMDVPEAEVQRPVTIAAGAKRSANGAESVSGRGRINEPLITTWQPRVGHFGGASQRVSSIMIHDRI